MLKNIFRTKTIESANEANAKGTLIRSLTYFDLIMLGIGAIIGTGIFVITGIAAAKYSGPAISLSFAIAGITCMFVAFAYAEIATMISNSGSVYTYSYVALGEIIAWITGWVMILEFTVSAASVASGWSGYTLGLLKSAGILLPSYLTKVPSEGGVINICASLISLLTTALLVKGTKESITLNTILVFIKLIVIFIFLIVAFPHFDFKNLGSNIQEFMPNSFSGITAGAAAVFLAFIGFDSIATATEECKNPERDITIGIIGSLLICTILYMLVSGMLVGITHDYHSLDNNAPIVNALKFHGKHFFSGIIALGAIAAMTSVLILNIYGQSRVLFVMARDGLLPQQFLKIHSKFHTPYLSTIYIGVSIALLSGLVPIHILAGIGSMGALIVFAVACFIVLILRIKAPNAKRPFKCPAVFITAPIAIICTLYLFIQLFFTPNFHISTHGVIFLSWIGISLLTYFLYAYKASNMNKITKT
jgi:APA family basic amino acid/polyamine antiporter